MILKGSQRGGAAQLAHHLLRTDENEHVEVEQLRGFVSEDLAGALGEAQAVAKGTRCRQYLFSLSINPPKDGGATRDDLMEAVERAEQKLGLEGHPRAVVIHEKNGRRHAHVVWSRIDQQEMKAVNMPFFKMRLAELSKDLYLEHGWELPAGHREKGKADPLNFELPEYQQAKRAGLDPRELKRVFQEAWKRSPDLKAFRHVLAEQGFFLAKGDRRGFVAVDPEGKVYSVARLVGIRIKELEARLGSPDQLQGLEAVKAGTKARLTPTLKSALKESRRQHRRELAPLRWKRRQVVRAQRAGRVTIVASHLRATTVAKKERVLRIRDWQQGAFQHLTGDRPFIRQQRANESFEDYQRFRRTMEAKFEEQLDELRMLQRAIDKVRIRQQAEQLAMIARMALAARLQRDGERNARENRPHQLTLEF